MDPDPPAPARSVLVRSLDGDPPKVPRAVIRQSSDGFEPIQGLTLVTAVDELRHGDRVLGGEDLMFLFDRSGDAVATEDAVADEEESHFLVESRKMEPEPVLELDQLVNLSCGNGDDGSASPSTALATNGTGCQPDSMHNSLKRSLNTPTLYYFRGTLDQLTFSTDGLFRIVAGKHFGSSDFSEMLAGILLSSVLHCKLSVVGIDKTLPRAMRAIGTTAAGTPDLYMVAKDGDPTKFIVSVKRFYAHDDRVNRRELAHHIMAKAVRGLEEYLSIIALPGNPCIIVLTCDEADARLVHAVYEAMNVCWPIYVIAIEDHSEMRRMVFRYTQADAEVIKELFTGKANLDFVKVHDVPWLGKEFLANYEEEDFSHEDLCLVFGDDGW